MNSLTTEITAPSLSSTQYGQDVSNRFKTIDQNFDKIIESEFLRGKKGDDIKIVEVDLKDSSNKFRSQIESVISEGKQHSPSMDSDGKTINWYDSFNEDAYSKIYLIYQTSEDNGDILISSLPYTFIDARFSKLNTDFDYSDLIDLSCTVYYQNENFVKVQNFPTLYFDDNIKQFCWMINNQKTGLIARGPQGSTGGNGSILLARFAEKADEEGWANIDQIYVNDVGDGKPGYINTTDALEKEKIILEEGYVVVGNAVINDQNKFIISPIRQTETGKWEANIKTGADLSGIVNAENLISSLKSLLNENCHGLFVPFKGGGGYHMFVPFINTDDGKHSLIFAPFEEINDSKSLPNVSLAINYQDLHIFGEVNILNDCNILRRCNISGDCSIGGKLIGTSFELNGPFRCISGTDCYITCGNERTNIVSDTVSLTDGLRSIEINNAEKTITLDNDGNSNVTIRPLKIEMSSNEISLDSDSIILGGRAFEDIAKRAICGYNYAKFESSHSDISSVGFPITSGVSGYNKHWILNRAIGLTGDTLNKDLYDYYYPNGIPTMKLDDVKTKIQQFNIDGSENGAVEYTIVNISGATRTLTFPIGINNRNLSKTYSLANNYKLLLQYNLRNGEWTLFAHDYD